jgi:hypothetical protein
MAIHYPNPALEAELEYRQQRIAESFRQGSRRGSWRSRRRHSPVA